MVTSPRPFSPPGRAPEARCWAAKAGSNPRTQWRLAVRGPAGEHGQRRAEAGRGGQRRTLYQACWHSSKHCGFTAEAQHARRGRNTPLVASEQQVHSHQLVACEQFQEFPLILDACNSATRHGCTLHKTRVYACDKPAAAGLLPAPILQQEVDAVIMPSLAGLPPTQAQHPQRARHGGPTPRPCAVMLFVMLAVHAWGSTWLRLVPAGPAQHL